MQRAKAKAKAKARGEGPGPGRPTGSIPTHAALSASSFRSAGRGGGEPGGCGGFTPCAAQRAEEGSRAQGKRQVACESTPQVVRAAQKAKTIGCASTSGFALLHAHPHVAVATGHSESPEKAAKSQLRTQ